METERTVGERVAAALLPALLHRIQNTTQLLTGLRTLLDMAPGEMPRRIADDLGAASKEAHEQGWLLGVLSSGFGADLLLAREEAHGLEPMLKLVRDGLRRVNRDLVWRDGEVPLLSARGRPRTAELCSAIAALCWDAGSEMQEGSRLSVRFECDDPRVLVSGSGGGGPALDSTFASLSGTLPGCSLERNGEAWGLQLPGEWLTFER